MSDIRTIEDFDGKTVAKTEFGSDDLGYGMFRITFTDGTKLVVRELSQTGMISCEQEDKA